ncbi:hypothetical protein Tco_0550319 [Tanacetum coccineum]
MVAFLEKSTGSAGFHQIIDFLNRSHICYALTKKPEVCVSFIKQFWRSAEASTDDNGEVKINATIDEIFEQLALMGYHTDSDKLTFQKGAFSPQWRFLIHNILHCLSPKKTAWEQFSSNIAAAVICLATNRKFNFSRMIFEHMVSNISSPHKFLMYPRFIQICLDMQRHQLQQHTRIYHVPSLSMKVFNNMKRPTKGFSGQEVALFPTMLDVTEPSTSPSRITSSPSHSPAPSTSHSPEPSTQHSPNNTTAAASQPSPTQPSPTFPSPRAEHYVPTPHDSPLHAVHSHGSDEGSLTLKELMNLVTKLSDRIGVLEADLMKTKKTYSSAYTKLILRVKKLESQIKIGKARRQARVVLSDDEVIEDNSSKQGRISDVELQEKASTDTELFIQEVTPTEVIQDQIVREKARDEVSNACAKKGTATEGIPIVSTAEDCKTMGLKEYKRAMDEAKSTKKIDWNDPSVIRYHTLKMKPKTVAQARRNMIKYLKNQGNYKISDFKGIMTSAEKDGKDDVAKETRAKRKKSIPRKSTRRGQKMEEDAEKEELKGF